METNARVIEVIFNAVDELNRQLPKDQQLSKSVDTRLTGKAATLDSIGLVNLIVITEQKVEQHFNIALTLAEDGLASADEGPFQSIGSLIEHISSVLEGKAHE